MLSAGGPVPGRRCAVLGAPISHSLSPFLHRAAYRVLGLDWTYTAVEVIEADLPAFLAGLDDTWRGLSLTMPLKRAVVPHLDEITERARQAEAANTVVLEDGRRRGHNTDVPGAAAAIRDGYDGPLERAALLGGGATAASVLLALADLGCRQATVLVRDPARADATVAAVGRHPQPPAVEIRRLGEPLPAPDIVVSTIPAAAQDRTVCALAGEAQVVFDVVYHPWPTPLAAAATAAGRPLITGLDLLVHQAVLQLELMTRLEAASSPEVAAAMREAGEAALASRSQSRP